MQTTYSCFSEKGETELPEIDELESILQSEVEPIIFLDSCVCLHIIKIVDYGKRAANIDFSKIIALKEYLSNNPININPFFGLMELCLKNEFFDVDKLRDFKHRIDFFEKIPLKEFKKFKYDFDRDYFIIKDIASDLPNPFEAFQPSLMNSYCALLKMRSLAKISLTSETAEKNINTFFDWMADILNSVRAVEYKLALNVFGGNSEYRKMIGLDSNIKDVKKKLMGTCWDIFHSKTTSNSFRLFELLGKNIAPFFLTSDANLFNIFKNLSLQLVKDGGGNFTSSFIFTSNFSFPHLKNDFVDKQNEKMMNVFIDRRNIKYEFDEEKVSNLIKELEIENKILDN
jgi:hypothetical protein